MKGLTLEQARSRHIFVNTDDIAAKGRLAYRMGIERRNNPETDPTPRTVWERGWDAAKTEFDAMLARWKNL